MPKPRLLVSVNTSEYDAETKRTSIKNIDWNNSSDKKWLASHMHWAVNNGHEITLLPHSRFI